MVEEKWKKPKQKGCAMTRIVAGIVLYNPDIARLSQNIHAIWDQVDKVYLVDNASSNLVEIEKLINEFSNICVLKNTENFGIAKALNQICGMAARDGNDWILTLDQDTICPKEIIKSFVPYTCESSVGIICPQFMIAEQTNKPISKGMGLVETIELCITSASLTRLAAWESMQGFNEWLFIDCVDYDYCIRLRIAGYKILRLNKVIIDHQVGNYAQRKLVFGKSVSLYNHSSFRNYYIVRNNIYMMRKYWTELHGIKWLLKFVFSELVKVLFENGRNEILSSIIRGTKDGFKARIH